ncbi:GntR family transcriptional regulator [Pseudonocardia ailaonensis]|uniref:GntR family transcriptional regulator n=1 Tax=Pseudonocardia ailaonensis TaxID=367279 RepID=A0ABN2NG45_9PSEU
MGSAIAAAGQGAAAFGRDLPGDQIYTRIREAILRNRLGPGTKLAEVKLCDIFGVNREVVRRVLIRLASDGIVDYYPKRGAFVASPTPEQVAHVRDARIAIETFLVADLAGRATEEGLRSLDEIAERQVEAQRVGDRDIAVELSGAFHVRLAEMGGNPLCTKYLLELTALTCLAIVKFGVDPNKGCLHQDHFAVTAALRRGEGAEAAEVMRTHLGGVHTAVLEQSRRTPRSWDLSGILTDPPDATDQLRQG